MKEERRHKYPMRVRRTALNLISGLSKRMGPDLFGWAVHKHLAIEAAKRKARKIQKEAAKKIAALERVSGVR